MWSLYFYYLYTSLYSIYSNGVGRTGAFIAMDMALEQAVKQGSIDVPAIVLKIRRQRMKMIQTLVRSCDQSCD